VGERTIEETAGKVLEERGGALNGLPYVVCLLLFTTTCSSSQQICAK